jgi:hypothetical protein
MRPFLTLAALMGSAFAAGNTGNNPTWVENQNVGTLNWQIALPGYSRAGDSSLQIRGYASDASINQGEKITFYITVNPVPQTYSLDVYRVGWYGGNGGQLKLHVGGLTGVSQPPPSYDSTTGLIACPWTASYTLDTSQPTLDTTGWTSGVYLALLTNASNYQSYIVFVIRDDARKADILYQQSAATYQAYNNFPDDGKTGKSLYDDGSYGQKTALGTQRAVKVSFDRPYTYPDHTGAGELLHFEIYYIRWIERNGYDVSYSTDVDTHTNGARILNYKAFAVVGHDEYWSQQMYDAAYAARDGGTSLAFFGSNSIFTQIRFEPSTLNGAPNRVITCYKDASLDPYNNPTNPLYNPALTTIDWRDLNRPEQQLVGVMYTSWMSADNAGDPYVVANSQTANGQLVYGGTGLSDGSSVPGVLGYEFDKQFTTYPTPLANTDPVSKSSVVSYSLLSRSPFTDAHNVSDYANSSIYQVSSGAWVFATGSMEWNWGLDGYLAPSSINTFAQPAPSVALQATTTNVLNLFIGSGSGVLPGPTNLTAIATVSSIALSWQDNTTAAAAYTVQRSADAASWTTLTTSLAPDATTYTDTVVGSFYYRVQATDSSGGSSSFSNVVYAATIPADPTGLSAMASPTSLVVNLSWMDNAATETAWVVERSSDGGTTWSVLVATLPANTQSYSDSNVTAGGTYSYRVKATNSSGSSQYSNVSSATVATQPVAPSNLTAITKGIGRSQKILLAWKDHTTSATHYVVDRSTDQTTWTRLTSTLGPTATSYSDGTVAKRTRYYYRVGVIIGSSPPIFSNTASATTR